MKAQIKASIVLLFLLIAIIANAEDNKNILTKNDSIKIKYFNKILDETNLFTYDFQIYSDSLLRLTPYDANLWQQKAMPLFKEKKYEKGMEYLDSAVKYCSTNYWLEYRAFIKCIFQKSYKEAIKDFEKVKSSNSDGIVMDHSYDFYLALCYIQLNDFTKAEYYLLSSIDKRIRMLREGHFLEYFYLGIIQLEKDQYENAIASFDKSLSVYKNFSDAKFYKAKCLINLKKNHEALGVLKDASLDLNAGYSISEDNALYEQYPYQVTKYRMEFVINDLEKEIENKK